MTWTLRREYRFEAAHSLPFVLEGHKCGRMHGHSYRVGVIIRGRKLVLGWLLDFAEIDAKAGPIIASLDHRTLNGILENPTSERLAKWLHDQIAPSFKGLRVSIEVSETDRSSVTYDGG